MSRTKYVKFGARADKNLSDLPNPTLALDNILDNISVQVDSDGNPLRFTSADLLPLVGIAQGPLGDRVDVNGNSTEFTQLANTTVEGTLVGSDNTSVIIEPKVTIQDHINNFKVSLGDPPWINGGTGPSATIASVERLNGNTINYPESLVNATQSRQGNEYRVLAGDATMTFDNLQLVCDSLYGDTTSTTRITSPVGNGVLETTAITNGLPCVITSSGSFDFTAVGASTANPPVGTRFLPTSSGTATGGSKVIVSKALGSLVKDKMYTITQVGTVSANGSEWSSIGVTGIPYVGQQFICSKAPADQTTVADAFALEHWSIGDRLTHNVPENFSANIGGIPARINLKNQTLPSGEGSTTLDPNSADLPVSQFYTKKVDTANLSDLITNADFWSDGHLQLTGPLHPDFSDVTGGAVWEGYQSGFFAPRFFTNAFFAIEEDVNEDNNWTFIKGINAFEFETLREVSWSTVNNVTRLTLHEVNDWKRICINHACSINGVEALVAKVYRAFDTNYGKYRYYADLDQDTGSTGYDYISFSYDRSEYDLSTDTTVIFTPPAEGKRRRVRYSAWWYTPDDNDQAQYLDAKLFEHDNGGTTPLSYAYFYPDSGETDVFGRYTFPYFVDNHAKVTKQESNSKLTVDNTVSLLLYSAKQAAADVFNHSSGAATISIEHFTHTNSTGKLETNSEIGTGAPFTTSSVGDVITILPSYDDTNDTTRAWTNASNKLWSFQILDKVSAEKAFVSQIFGSGAGVAATTTLRFISSKNEGLVGVYKAKRLSNTSIEIRLVDGVAGSFQRSVLDIVEGDLLYYGEVPKSAASGSLSVSDKPYLIEKVVESGGVATLTVSDHPSLATDVLATLNFGVAHIYSSRGLNDVTGVYECGGVFGVEVASNNTLSDGNSNSELTLTATNYSRIAVNDRVYFESAIPQATQPGLVGEATLVASTPGSNKITLKNESGTTVNITADVNAGATIIIVPHTNYSSSTTELRKNREYCVIPLNTAPPFGSYAEGLQTTDSFPNLEVKELAFKEFSYETSKDITFTGVPITNGYLYNYPASLNLSTSPTEFQVGDFIKAEGTDTNGVLSQFSSGIIYRIGALGTDNNAKLQYWNTNQWSNVNDSGSLPNITFTRLGSALSLEDINFAETTGQSANRGSETSNQAQEPDSYIEICYTPSGGSEETYRVLANSRSNKTA